MSDFDDDEALAAEYVIGTLFRDEHAAAEARRQRDPAFDAMIRAWTERLAPLMETSPAVEPDDRVRVALMGEIDRLRDLATGGPSGTGNVVQLRREVTRWRVATALCGALAALLAIWVATLRSLPPPEPGVYMAVLQKGAGAPAFLVSLDLAHRRMTVLPTDTTAEPNKSFELWMIGSDAAGPRSLEIVDNPTPVRAALPNVSPELISHATYAVTIEPKGGSPTGKPTAAPVFTGHLVPMDPGGSR